MPDTTLDTIDKLLQGVQEDIDDADTRYKIRNARQLLGVLQQRSETLHDAIDETVSDEDILDNLRELGYL